ncbi:hypothetical protein CEN47_00570 [Fischerella thermalis CCMEE 5319]|nr:hypothetical protein CEN47_00570 [Fischerella thermalis CCMEE 5319]
MTSTGGLSCSLCSQHLFKFFQLRSPAWIWTNSFCITTCWDTFFGTTTTARLLRFFTFFRCASTSATTSLISSFGS